MVVRCVMLGVLLLVSACGRPADLSEGLDLRLPDGDRVVRTQPGTCEKNCVVSDPTFESVIEVAGAERTDAELGHALAGSLAGTGWEVIPDDGFGYAADEDTPEQAWYPASWVRKSGNTRSYLLLFPVAPGSYGLAYDENGDSIVVE